MHGMITRRTQCVGIQFTLAQVEWQPETSNVITNTTPHQSVLSRVQLKWSNGISHQHSNLQDGNENTASQHKEKQLPDPRLSPVIRVSVSRSWRRIANSLFDPTRSWRKNVAEGDGRDHVRYYCKWFFRTGHSLTLGDQQRNTRKTRILTINWTPPNLFANGKKCNNIIFATGNEFSTMIHPIWRSIDPNQHLLHVVMIQAHHFS